MSITALLRVCALWGVLLGSGCVFDGGDSRADRMTNTSLNQDLFGLWVTRWDFQSAEDVRTIIDDAGKASRTCSGRFVGRGMRTTARRLSPGART